jgi:magnesium transporter
MIRSLVAAYDPETDAYKVRRNLTTESLEAALEGDDLIWIDVVDQNEEEVHWLEKTFHLNPAVVSDLLREDRRPALMVYPKYLFLSLFQPHIHLLAVSGKEIHCLIGERFFITVRQPDASAVDDAYDRVVQNPEAWRQGVAYFLYLTSQRVIDAYYPLLDTMSNQLNEMEERMMISEVDKSARKPIYRIKQQLINLRQMVAPQREVLSNVIGEQRLAGNEDTRDLFRHLYERLLRVYDVIDSQRDLSSNVLDQMQNQESRKLVEAVNRLTILSMIFLPLTFFTGLFELNFATTVDPVVLPISGTFMFLLVVTLMFSSATSMVLIFRRRGWL